MVDWSVCWPFGYVDHSYLDIDSHFDGMYFLWNDLFMIGPLKPVHLTTLEASTPSFGNQTVSLKFTAVEKRNLP